MGKKPALEHLQTNLNQEEADQTLIKPHASLSPRLHGVRQLVGDHQADPLLGGRHRGLRCLRGLAKRRSGACGLDSEKECRKGRQTTMKQMAPNGALREPLLGLFPL